MTRLVCLAPSRCTPQAETPYTRQAVRSALFEDCVQVGGHPSRFAPLRSALVRSVRLRSAKPVRQTKICLA